MIVRPGREVADLRRYRSLRYDADEVVGHLQKAALDLETAGSRANADAELAAAKERDHRRVARENAHLAVERRGND